MSRKVLVVEDQKDIAELVSMHISDLGLEVDTVNDGISGLKAAQTGQYSALVLDVMLPGMDGLAIVRQIRMDRNQVPVLMLTAKSTEIDRVVGLELGADDYLTKPFSIPELQARVKALLRRAEMQSISDDASTKSNDEKIVINDLSIDCSSHLVTLRGQELSLTSKEYDLLLHFARGPGRVYNRTQLLEAVWGTTYEGYEHNVNTHINRLRAKLEKDPANPEYVLTVRGVGYRFVTPNT
jgi:two-component system, OmpR family, response regulator